MACAALLAILSSYDLLRLIVHWLIENDEDDVKKPPAPPPPPLLLLARRSSSATATANGCQPKGTSPIPAPRASQASIEEARARAAAVGATSLSVSEYASI